jgi:hypothetical protein
MKRFAHRASTKRVSYRVTKGACKGCAFQSRCTPTGQDRTISHFFEQKLVDEAKERLSSARGIELLLQRKVNAEWVFAWAKELHGLRRTRFMGRWKVQIQVWLTAAVINIKKAERILDKIEAIAGGSRNYQQGFPTSVTHAAENIASVIHLILFCFWRYFGNISP